MLKRFIPVNNDQASIWAVNISYSRTFSVSGSENFGFDVDGMLSDPQNTENGLLNFY